MTDTWEASFGDLDFSPGAQFGDVEVTVYGLKRGKHTRVTAVADSLIQDGSIERVVRDDNRDVQLILCIDGTDSEALAQYEADLFREVNRGRNEFRWTPPDGFGATAVFDVLWADLAFADESDVWDLDEIRGRRNYVLTMRCLPFARSVDSFTAAGVTSGATPTTVTINDATTSTGWFRQDRLGGPLTAVGHSGGEVSVPVQYGYFTEDPSIVYKPAAPVDMTGTPYLTVHWRFSSNMGVYSYDRRTSRADGTPMTNLGLHRPANTGWNGPFETTYLCADTSVSEFTIQPPSSSIYEGGGTSGTFYIDKIVRSNQAPYTGTLRQKSVTIDVPGSARTPASLEVGHASSGLGNVLVYTSATSSLMSSPALSPFTQGTTNNAPTFISGRSFDAPQRTFVVPVSALGRGPHQIVMRANEANWIVSATLLVDGVAVGSTVTGRASSVLLPADSAGMPIYSLGSMTLPPHEVPEGSNATVQVSVQRADLSGDNPRVDEVWAFPMPDDGTAHLSAVAVDARKRVWLDAPTVDRPNPACYVGNATDRTDSFGVDGALSNWDEHYFMGGSNQVFVVTSTALDAQVELEGHARWLTHPAA